MSLFPIFKPKQGPVLKWSRVVHFLVAATACGYGGHLLGYGGSIWSGIGTIALGLGWEVSNKFMPGTHQYGDALDFWAFVAGALVSGVGYNLLS
jgi:hypothetical protein